MTAIETVGRRFMSTPTNGHWVTALGLPWQSPIQVLTEVDVALTAVKVPLSKPWSAPNDLAEMCFKRSNEYRVSDSQPVYAGYVLQDQ